jgi:hypothetical protein
VILPGHIFKMSQYTPSAQLQREHSAQFPQILLSKSSVQKQEMAKHWHITFLSIIFRGTQISALFENYSS